MLAATSLTAGAQAQQMVVNKAKALDLTANVQKTVAKPADFKAVQSFSTPSRSIEDGVYYARPLGVYYSSYMFGSGETGTPGWLVPGLVPVTYHNLCTPADQATWSIAYSNGSVEDLNEYTDVDNNLKYKWGINPYCDPQSIVIGMSAPTIMQGNSSFTAPFWQVVATDVTPQVNYNPKNEEVYTVGLPEGPAFGTGSVFEENLLSDGSITKVHGLMEVFEKPLSPMYVESFQLPFISYQENPLNGKELTLKVFGMDADGHLDREAKEVLVCNSCEVEGSQVDDNGQTFWYGDVIFSKLTENEFGDKVALPFVIDYDYAVEVGGYQQEGVSTIFRMVIVEDAYDMVNDAPTSFSCELADGSFGYYSFNFNNGTAIPKTVIYTNVFYDGVELLEPYKSLVVSNDGQTVLTDNPNMEEDKKVNYVPFSSAAPFFVYDKDGEVKGQNYDVVGLPDWLEVDGVADDPREEFGYSAIFFKAEPLPAGTEGRYATIYIVGRGGVKNAQPITVRQGSVTGIDSVIAEGDANAIYYNVSGQRVNNAKGLVISKAGKRIIK